MNSLTDYDCHELLHESAACQVYRGIRRTDGLSVIVKMPAVMGSSPHRLRYEYEILHALREVPGVPRGLDLVEHQGRSALVSEDIGATSLRKILEERVLSIEEFLDIAIRLTEVVGRVHEAGIVHKDINPSNVIVRRATSEAQLIEVQLIDFGIASRLPRETQSVKSPNLIEGTLSYLSPEQTGRMNRAVDYRSDFYSLGMTFYEMLTQRTAFVAVDAMELVHCHIARKPEPPHVHREQVPEALSAIVLKLLSKTSEERYQSAFGLLHDLRSCRDQLMRGEPIAGLVPGSRDIPRRLQIPEKLYGREREAAELLSAFERASTGQLELLLVSGYSGIGKSSLVHELHKPVVRQHAYFASGKFDQYKHDIPYDSIVQAFRQLCRQFLLEDDSRVARWREHITAALGHNAQILVSAIPELELLIGKQPPVPEVGPAEAQARLLAVFQAFTGLFAELGHSLALFLDDLQWADPASLTLLKGLVTNPDARNILIIGAYRDNEVSATHPLTLAIEEVSKAVGTRVHALSMRPLTSEDIAALVSDTLRCSPERSAELAQLLEEKTLGNPFFLSQLLTSLYQEDLVRFDVERGAWEWDIEQVRRARITDNVVDLMVAKIRKLSPETQEILRVASCLGNHFALSVLAVARKRGVAETARELWEALKEGLIVPVDERYRDSEACTAPLLSGGDDIQYRFLHDRVQQSAYATIPEADRPALRLEIGRMLLKASKGSDLGAQVFDVLGHLAEGVALITDQSERNEIAAVALSAGKRARQATAYDTARRVLTFGMTLLADPAWEHSYDLIYQLHLEHLQCEYLCGNLEEAGRSFREIMSRARSRLHKCEAYLIQIVLNENSGRFAEALSCLLEALHLLGVDVSPDTSDAEVSQLLAEVKAEMRGRKPSDLLGSSEMQDPEQVMLSMVLVASFGTAYFIGINFYRMLTLRCALVFLRHGVNPYAPMAFSTLSMVLVELHDFSTAYDFGELALAQVEKLGSNDVRGKVYFQFGDWVNCHRNHIRTDIPWLRKAFEACTRVGDLPYASYSATHLVRAFLLTGRNLAETHEETARWLEYTRRVKNLEMIDCISCVDRVVVRLMGQPRRSPTEAADAQAEEARFEEHVVKNRSVVTQSYYYHHRSFAEYVLGEFEAARKTTEQSEKVIWAVHGQHQVDEHAFLQSLILLSALPGAPEPERSQILVRVESHRKLLRALADSAPMNYGHKLALVSAELARVTGEHETASRLYDDALAAALDEGFVQIAALASECAMRFYLQQRRPARARGYLIEALQHYASWGAQRKVKRLTEEYRHLLPNTGRLSTRDSVATGSDTSFAGSEGLDLLSVTKATQAISSEIRLERLLDRLTKILIESAGAERGFILLRTGDQFVVQASGALGAETTEVLQSLPFHQCALAASIVQYVIRTGEAVVLDHAAAQGAFAADPHIASNKVKSLSCLPFSSQGRIVGLVYLENNLSEGCFTIDRLAVLRILLTQMSISFENATLYATLEDKVRERTEELRQAQEHLLALEKAETERQMAGGFAHELRNALSGPKAALAQALGLAEENSLEQPPESLPHANARALEGLYKLASAHVPAEEQGRLRTLTRGIYENDQYLEELLQIVDRALSRGLTITQQIMEYAKTGQSRGELVQEDINQVIVELKPELDRELAKMGIVLKLDLDPELPTVLCQETELVSVFRNIVQNARDALTEIPSSSTGQRFIEVRTRHDAGRALLSIADNGPGIPEETLKRIFEPFFSTKPQTGTGLGLALVRKIVALRRGDISVDTQVGKGTTFHVSFPAQAALRRISA